MNKVVVNISPAVKMSDFIVAYPATITILERLGIAFGFGDKNVKEIAGKYNLNLQAFMSILEVFEGVVPEEAALDKSAIPDLLSFLKASHKYFKETQIPNIKELIVSFSDKIPAKYGSVIVSFFDGYMQEVSEHFHYEDDVVFPYIDSILNGPDPNGFKIKEFEKNHTDIEQKLLDLKNILIKYIPEDISSPLRIQILRELITLEQDLIFHTYIEDRLLVPSIKRMESTAKKR